MGIRGVFSKPCHPESNGQVKRVNSTLERILRKLVIDNPSSWSIHLHLVVFAYNIGFHSSTKHSPFQMLYGRHLAKPPLLYSMVKDTESLNLYEYIKQLVKSLIAIQSDAYT